MPESHQDPSTSNPEAGTNLSALADPRGQYQIEDDEFTLLDIAVAVAENLRLLIVGPLLAGMIALAYAYTIAPTFTARTSFLPPQQQQSATAAMLAQLGGLATAVASSSGIRNPADQYVALLESASIADGLLDRFGLVELYEVEYRQDARKALKAKTAITAGKDGLIVVEVTDRSPQRAADIANAYVSELARLLGRLALSEAQQRRLFFEKQLEQARNGLTDAELALRAAGIGVDAIKVNPTAAIEAVAVLQAKVSAQEVKLAAMRNYLTESSAEFQQAKTELAALRSQLQKIEATDSSLTSGGGYTEKFRDFKYQETLFEIFVRQYELAKADEAREGAIIQIVDTAVPPERKSHPKKALIAVLTTLVTGVFLLVAVFASRAIKNSEQNFISAQKLAAIRTYIRKALKR